MTEQYKESVKELEGVADNIINSMKDQEETLEHLMDAYKYLHTTKDMTDDSLKAVLNPLKGKIEEIKELYSPMLKKFADYMAEIKIKIELLGPESSQVFNWKRDIEYEIINEKKIIPTYWKKVLDDKKIKNAIEAGIEIEGIKAIKSAPKLIIKPTYWKKENK